MLESFDIDQHSDLPPYEQLRREVLSQIDDGRLVAGDKLPTVRKMAGDLGVAVNTAAKAYRALENAGSIETRGRHGTFVAALADRDAAAQDAADDFARRVHDLGIGRDAALRFAAAALDAK